MIAAAPVPSRRVLDVGCGTGALTRRLAGATGAEVLGVDVAPHMIELARSRSHDDDVSEHVSYVLGDFLELDLPDGSFDLVVSVAALHHFDFDAGLRRMADLVAPGGRLFVIGLARDASVVDVAASTVGVLQLRTLGRLRRRSARADAGNADAMPIRDPTMTYRDIRDRAREVLPDATYRRHPMFRYSLRWERPAA